MRENPLGVMLSATKHLAFSVLTKARSFACRLRMTLRHSLSRERMTHASLSMCNYT